MTAINKLLDKARETCGLTSDMALGEKLKVSRSAVSLWRKGGVIRDEHLTELIALAKADPAIAVQVMSEQARTKHEKSVWGALARQLGVAATVAAVTLAGWFPAPSHAATEPTLTNAPYMHYAKLSSLAGKFRKALARWLATWSNSHGSPALLA